MNKKYSFDCVFDHEKDSLVVVVVWSDAIGPTKIGIPTAAISNKVMISAAKIRRIHEHFDDDAVPVAGAPLGMEMEQNEITVKILPLGAYWNDPLVLLSFIAKTDDPSAAVGALPTADWASFFAAPAVIEFGIGSLLSMSGVSLCGSGWGI